MLRCGIVRSGIVRNWGWAEGAEGAEGALFALGTDGALGAHCAEAVLGAPGADCAEGALGAEPTEGALGADCFGCAALIAGCVGSPRDSWLWPRFGT